MIGAACPSFPRVAYFFCAVALDVRVDNLYLKGGHYDC